jgi:hypothetical protein
MKLRFLIVCCCLVAPALICASALAQPPSVTTGAASDVSQGTATLSATVNPDGLQTIYRFDLGTTPTYGIPVFGDAGSVAVDQTLTTAFSNLRPGTTYHYRIGANNADGAVVGTDHTFTTAPGPSPLAADPATFPSLSGLTPQRPTKEATVTPPRRKTRARKLAKALRACKRKPKRRREGCQKKARGRYGAIRRATTRRATTRRATTRRATTSRATTSRATTSRARQSGARRPRGVTRRVAPGDSLVFAPTFLMRPDATAVDSPSGAAIDLHVPPTEGPGQPATTELKNAVIALPVGLSLSLASAEGLAACDEEQFAVNSSQPASCPTTSQVGSAEIHSPLVDHPLPGTIYLGTPACGPCTDADAAGGKLLRLYIAVSDPQSGALLKFSGSVAIEESTGQLTATFSFRQNPEVPIEDLDLSFNSGPGALLATPVSCGAYTSTTDLTPWSAGGTPETPDATPSSTFDISWDGAGGACPASLPFSTSFSAGTAQARANAFSPLTVSFGRSDGQQTLSQARVRLPPGLLGAISSVVPCAEPQASQGTCEAASQIGHATVAVGPGSHAFSVPGSVYLTGPYKGAPFGLSIVVAAQVGPFNLGTVLVRASIDADPHDSHVTVTSEPFPQILAGVPLRIQSVSLAIDRPGFTFNPTNCAPQAIAASIAAAQGATANVSSPFQASGCGGLPFSPKLSASTSGRASKKNGAGLEVKIVEGVAGEANAHLVKVDLPKQLSSRLTTIQKACTLAQFESNPADCPAASVVGTATASTPVLPVALSGPAFLVSHGGAGFPDLVVVLQGDGVTFDLVGSTDIKQGITSSTFQTIPDVPVVSFELTLPPGPFSALTTNLPATAHYNLCGSSLAMPTTIVAQNGAEIKQTTKIAISGCPKLKQAVRKRAARKKVKQAHKHKKKQSTKGKQRGMGFN